jgi:hypothetical protein
MIDISSFSIGFVIFVRSGFIAVILNRVLQNVVQDFLTVLSLL